MISPLWWYLLTLPMTFGCLALYFVKRMFDVVLSPPFNIYVVLLMFVALFAALLVVAADFVQAAFFLRTRRVKGEPPPLIRGEWVMFRDFSIRERTAGTAAYRRMRCSETHGKYLSEHLDKGVRGEFYITDPGILRPARLRAFVDTASGITLPPLEMSRKTRNHALCSALVFSSLFAAVGSVLLGIYPWFSQVSPEYFHRAINAYGARSLSLTLVYGLTFGAWLAFRNSEEERALQFVKRNGLH